MDFRIFFRICVLFFSIDITFSEDDRKHAPTSKTLLEVCLEEHGLSLNTNLKKLGLFKLGEVMSCMNNKYITKETETGKLEADLKKQGVFKMLRNKIEVLQWVFLSEPAVLKQLKKKTKVVVPAEVTEDGKAAYIGRYRAWIAIFSHSEGGFVADLKGHFVRLGVKDQEKMAQGMALLFCRLSGIIHGAEENIQFDNEEQVIDALKAWKITNDDVLNVARAIYRLGLP